MHFLLLWSLLHCQVLLLRLLQSHRLAAVLWFSELPVLPALPCLLLLCLLPLLQVLQCGSLRPADRCSLLPVISGHHSEYRMRLLLLRLRLSYPALLLRLLWSHCLWMLLPLHLCPDSLFLLSAVPDSSLLRPGQTGLLLLLSHLLPVLHMHFLLLWSLLHRQVLLLRLLRSHRLPAVLWLSELPVFPVLPCLLLLCLLPPVQVLQCGSLLRSDLCSLLPELSDLLSVCCMRLLLLLPHLSYPALLLWLLWSHCLRMLLPLHPSGFSVLPAVSLLPESEWSFLPEPEHHNWKPVSSHLRKVHRMHFLLLLRFLFSRVLHLQVLRSVLLLHLHRSVSFHPLQVLHLFSVCPDLLLHRLTVRQFLLLILHCWSKQLHLQGSLWSLLFQHHDNPLHFCMRSVLW